MRDHNALLARLERVRETTPTKPYQSRTGMARCPVHNDRTPSLSWMVTTDGRFVICCHACNCTREAFAAAIGANVTDLYEERDGQADRKLESRRRPVAYYDYRDESGTLLYQAIRYVYADGSKTFSFRSPVPGKGDGWVNTIVGVRRVLYRLPDLLAEPEATILVVEGERDVDNLRKAGFVATTNCGGAGTGEGGCAGKWLDSYSRSLRGRHCVVIPDLDPPGMRHALYVLGSLVMHGAGSVRLLLLPHGKDASDYLQGGGTREELTALMDALPAWRATK